MDDLEAVARMGTAQLRALVTPPRHCRPCGVELEDRPGPGRPLVWCEAHRTAIGRRPTGRVCAGCGVSLDGRRRQTIVVRRALPLPHQAPDAPGVNGWAPRSPTGATGRPRAAPVPRPGRGGCLCAVGPRLGWTGIGRHGRKGWRWCRRSVRLFARDGPKGTHSVEALAREGDDDGVVAGRDRLQPG